MSEAVLADATGNCYLDGGIVGGFAGLTAGAWYELSSTAGEITAGDTFAVGVALDANQIKLIKGAGVTLQI